MTERDQLLRAILDAPDDDTPRLVYADKLDELGGARNAARAEFIRVQVEIARTPRYLSTGVPITQRIDTGSYGSAAEELVVGYSTQPLPNPCHAELRAREQALLKRWANAWLPNCLRPGYPGLAVSGSTVAVDPLGGYVRFERGFIGHAGRELPCGPPDEVPHVIGRFAAQLRALFESNPLTGASISFEGGSETLHAEVTTGVDGIPARYWRVMWDMNTYCQLSHDMIEQPVTLNERAQVGYALEKWLRRALVAPARAVALTREMEALAPAPDDGLDFTEYTEALMQDMIQGMGIPPHLAGDEPS